MSPNDWYTVQQVASGVHAIGEPHYHQQNWSYLICGGERALLFDTGSYYGEIAPIVAGLTDLPLTVIPSHMHYDHLGNVLAFDTVVLPDLPILRDCATDGIMTPTETLFLGKSEDRVPPSFAVAGWLPIGSTIQLGDTALTLLHTPGHSPDSVSLWWPEADLLFAADFLYHGPLYAQVPGARLTDYAETARTLRDTIRDTTRILGAHGNAPSPGAATAPELDRSGLDALLTCLKTLRAAPPELSGKATKELTVSPLNTLIINSEALRGFH
ncbi:MBL fold metallo-hydrolase [Roseovarius pelagicus]|uniref:MBL fold metallo-hydrolase n=1 Tax=Roseovarius pelagicus TaxID=2980108 RepID=A0ABY6DAD3_9RHOB|nr:MBL fold metallo-hydrolase [Roseovarius pelagicus]UXX82143.1 MBL fold metallo-hydrolase [Roseovarius pelagicus]